MIEPLEINKESHELIRDFNELIEAFIQKTGLCPKLEICPYYKRELGISVLKGYTWKIEGYDFGRVSND